MPRIILKTESSDTITRRIPVVTESYEDLEPAHTPRDFVISTDGELKRYQGSRRHVIIPKNVRKIGEGAFQDPPLKTVFIPQWVECVGKRAFYNCGDLTGVYFEENKEMISLPRLPKIYAYRLTIEEEAFAFPLQRGTYRGILLPRHLSKAAPNAFFNELSNEYLVYPYSFRFGETLPSILSFNHLHLHYDKEDLETYIAEYAQHKETEFLNPTFPLKRKIYTIQQRELNPEIKSKDYLNRCLEQATGVFQIKRRKDLEKAIAKSEEKIASLNAQIKSLENEIASHLRQRDAIVAEFAAFSHERQLEIVEREIKDSFPQRVESGKRAWESLKRLDLEQEHMNAFWKNLPAEQEQVPMSNPSYSTAVPPSFGNAPYQQPIPESTFTGNQLEDYGKLRAKILSGDVTNSELQEFGSKWGYLP